MAEPETKKEKIVQEEAQAEESEEEVEKIQSKEEAEAPKEQAEEAPKEKKKTEDKAGIVYISSSYNNTIVHITDLGGNTISRISGGMITKHDRLKANPTIAMFVAKRAAERAKDLGINSLYIRTKGKTGAPGMGPGGHAAVKALGKEGFRIISILDSTKFPRGGPKRKGGRRGRRV